ncbi:fumarylacetoacetate hydrolase family protein [Brevibacterium sp. UCMA 11754]|nr:fumarylacetoacetate hydrolase family protein [Brevibacterium sp. UCMA 11754]
MEKIERCATALRQTFLRNSVIDALPAEAVPATRAEAYAVQTRYAELEGQPTVGWKIAATSQAGQRHINVDGPLGGRVLSDRAHADGDAVSLNGNTMCLAEPEFVLGSALAPRTNPYTLDDVLEAVTALHFGIELPSTRFTDVTAAGALQLIADNACGHRFVLGSAVKTTWAPADLAAVSMTADVDGPSGHRTSEGVGKNVLGDPVAALTWLVNELSAIDIGLVPGDFITTGTCSEPIPVEPGDSLSARFDDLGVVTCTFVD